MGAAFLRLVDSEHKAELLAQLVLLETSPRRFGIEPVDFRAVPGAPFAYWTTRGVRSIFRTVGAFQTSRRFAVRGAYTTNDFRFYRLDWEVPIPFRAWSREQTFGKRGYPCLAKGGQHSPYYHDPHLVVRWHNDGAEAKAYLSSYRQAKGWGTDWSACLNGYQEYFRPGLTWALRTTSSLSFRVMPSGCIFGHKGPGSFMEGNDPTMLLALCAVLDSAPFGALVALQTAAADAAARSYEVGLIQQTPVPDLAPHESLLAERARRAWCLKRTLDSRTETSHAFHLPALLQAEGLTLAERASAWLARSVDVEDQVGRIQVEIDKLCFDLYGMSEDDQSAIAQGGGVVGEEQSAGDEADEHANEDEDDSAEEKEVDVDPMVASLLSWSVGVAFGRFDVRPATSKSEPPPAPDPFDPLPACSPGMLSGGDGLPVAGPPVAYPVLFPPDGVLVDDLGADRDLLARVRQVFGVVFGTSGDELLREATELLDPRAVDLRQWLRSKFFGLHVQRYSKSRRKAPIYWQLGTPSASYSVWIYIHRMGPDTLHAVLRDHVEPKLRFEENRLAALSVEAVDPTPAQRKALEAQETFVDELRAFRDEFQRVAPLWNPDLDDGVVINASFLHRLFAHTRSWANECETHWKKLQAGEYNWTHLAMRLWPEKVVPECREDRSLAIAHGLEDLFWIEDTKGWRLREVPDAEAERVLRRWTDEHCQGLLDALRAWCEAHGGHLQWSRWASGELDDDPLAGRLFPARVFERAKSDADFAARHDLSGLHGRSLDDRTGGRRSPTWRDVLESRQPYWTRKLTEALDEAAAALGPERAGQLLRALSDGELDQLPLGRIAAPERMLARCRADVDFAAGHGVQAIFWLVEDGRWRLRRDPAVEENDAMAARTSSAVKDALKQVASAQAPEKPSRGGGRVPTPKPARAATTRTKTKQMPLDLAALASGPDQGVLDALRAALHQFPEGAGKSELLAASGLDENQWKSALDTLTASGEVDRTGQKRGTRYTLRRAGGSS